MANKRSAIAIEIRREVLFEARHHCAVCCMALPLEYAHIIPWHKTREHSIPNLIALCANCHSRADKEKWGESYLKRYKDKPCILERNTLPHMPPEKKMLIEAIIESDYDHMTPRQQLMLQSMLAAYLGIPLQHVEIQSVTPSNSLRIQLSLPKDAALQFISGYESNDPKLRAFLDGIELLKVAEILINPLDKVAKSKSDETAERIYEFIARYIKDNGFPPTIRKISEACYISVATVIRYLDSLEQQGRIRRTVGRAKSIHIIEED